MRLSTKRENCSLERFIRGCAHWRLGFGIVVDLEVKGGLAYAVADGIAGNALFLYTQGPFFRVGQPHAVNAGLPQLVVKVFL